MLTCCCLICLFPVTYSFLGIGKLSKFGTGNDPLILMLHSLSLTHSSRYLFYPPKFPNGSIPFQVPPLRSAEIVILFSRPKTFLVSRQCLTTHTFGDFSDCVCENGKEATIWSMTFLTYTHAHTHFRIMLVSRGGKVL